MSSVQESEPDQSDREIFPESLESGSGHESGDEDNIFSAASKFLNKRELRSESAATGAKKARLKIQLDSLAKIRSFKRTLSKAVDKVTDGFEKEVQTLIDAVATVESSRTSQLEAHIQCLRTDFCEFIIKMNGRDKHGSPDKGSKSELDKLTAENMQLRSDLKREKQLRGLAEEQLQLKTEQLNTKVQEYEKEVKKLSTMVSENDEFRRRIQMACGIERG